MTTLSKRNGIHGYGGLEVDHATETVTRTVKVALSDATGAGGILAWENPEIGPILVHGFVLDITTEATGAATADAGVAADGTTSSDTLIDAGDVGAAAVVLSAVNDAGTNGGTDRKMAAGEYITVSGNSDPAGLVGNAYITYSLI